jgi:uncharacterized protein (TIGR00297 family)
MRPKLAWQSKLVLLVVAPAAGADLMLEAPWWAAQVPTVAVEALALSLLLALVTWKLRAATPWGSLTGAAITASLIFSTETYPYQPWRTALLPVLAVALLAHAATRLGRGRKERQGTAESRHGRSSAQVAANLGAAMLATHPMTLTALAACGWFSRATSEPLPFFAVALAALAEAAADTVSSEIGQAFGGRPRLITTLRPVAPGTNGAVSLAGTLAGALAALLVAALGAWAVRGSLSTFIVAAAAAVFGLLFDSLLGATIEDRGALNNDAVNFLSTVAAAVFALGLLAIHP